MNKKLEKEIEQAKYEDVTANKVIVVIAIIILLLTVGPSIVIYLKTLF